MQSRSCSASWSAPHLGHRAADRKPRGAITLGALAAFMLATLGACAMNEPVPGPFVPAAIPYPPDALVRYEDQYLYEIERIAPHVYAIQSPEPFHYQPLGNVTAIEQADGWVLIDAGGTQAAAERIIALLRFPRGASRPRSTRRRSETAGPAARPAPRSPAGRRTSSRESNRGRNRISPRP